MGAGRGCWGGGGCDACWLRAVCCVADLEAVCVPAAAVRRILIAVAWIKGTLSLGSAGLTQNERTLAWIDRGRRSCGRTVLLPGPCINVA
eukprot:COSAG01_NODE_594_length_15086_cov_39.948805_11_plen_90_part_00